MTFHKCSVAHKRRIAEAIEDDATLWVIGANQVRLEQIKDIIQEEQDDDLFADF